MLRPWNKNDQPGNDITKLLSLRVIDETYNTRSHFEVTEMVGLEMNYEVLQEGHVLWLGYNIHNQYGVNVFDTHSVSSELYKKTHEKGKYRAIAWIPGNLLNAGGYYIGCAIFNHLKKIIHFHEKEILFFNIYETVDENNARGMSGDDFPGVIRPLLKWVIDRV